MNKKLDEAINELAKSLEPNDPDPSVAARRAAEDLAKGGKGGKGGKAEEYEDEGAEGEGAEEEGAEEEDAEEEDEGEKMAKSRGTIELPDGTVVADAGQILDAIRRELSQQRKEARQLKRAVTVMLKSQGVSLDLLKRSGEGIALPKSVLAAGRASLSPLQKSRTESSAARKASPEEVEQHKLKAYRLLADGKVPEQDYRLLKSFVMTDTMAKALGLDG